MRTNSCLAASAATLQESVIAQFEERARALAASARCESVAGIMTTEMGRIGSLMHLSRSLGRASVKPLALQQGSKRQREALPRAVAKAHSAEGGQSRGGRPGLGDEKRRARRAAEAREAACVPPPPRRNPPLSCSLAFQSRLIVTISLGAHLP